MGNSLSSLKVISLKCDFFLFLRVKEFDMSIVIDIFEHYLWMKKKCLNVDNSLSTFKLL